MSEIGVFVCFLLDLSGYQLLTEQASVGEGGFMCPFKSERAHVSAWRVAAHLLCAPGAAGMGQEAFFAGSGAATRADVETWAEKGA